MISKNRRNIYIGIIIASILGSLGVFMFFKPSVPVLPDLTAAPSAGAPSAKDGGLPKVFPQDATFDLSVFNSAKFKKLKGLSQLKVESDELGKEDPFRP